MAHSYYAGLAVIAVSALASVNPTRRATYVVEDRVAPPSSFASFGTPAAETRINLRVGLAAFNLLGLETALYDVSTPGSSKYGQHLSLDEVKAYAVPSSDAVSAVTSWLEGTAGVSNITQIGTFGDWISFSTDISTANELLDANFEFFVHMETGKSMVRTMSYSVPQDLVRYIDLVHPTISFASPIPKKQKLMSAPKGLKNNTNSRRINTAPASCNDAMTPTCLQDLYAIPSTPATQSSNGLAVSGFINEFAEESDLQIFLADFRPDMSSTTTFTLETVDGGSNPQGPNEAGVEASLDIQYAVGLATDVPVFFVSVGPDTIDDGVDSFIEIIDFLNAETSPPQVLTTSYGFNEPDVGAALATKVTSVGATRLNASSESAALFSSGGFSNFFPTPSYQSSDVSAYLSTLGTAFSGLYNASGRGFPDVSAQGWAVDVIWEGELIQQYGTSCSTPIFASIIALINDRLLAAGNPVLGFLNPFLYANPSAFFDITSGQNIGCDSNVDGFSASTGWDAISGLGTPNFDALLAAAGL
ncbi:family S53 protease [Rhodocollybia butyracea]|uniref:Family S53 protease n=1 Tax=Rhodocollybia butyracea TaxID=206335 RepID=A0A9P5PKK5_9AGAR|nr:family S53 protease [Rhodocollybia butyracea]